VGAAAGGGYDLAGRVVQRFIGKHIPGNPTVIVRNMPGSASVRMTNFLFNVAPKDGSVIGVPNNGLPFEARLHLMSRDGKNLRFDVARMQWVGTPVQEPQVAYYWHEAPVRAIDDLKKGGIPMGATTAGGDNFMLPSLMNQMLGTRMTIVTGYKGQAGIFAALERGEVQGNTTGLSNLLVRKAAWVKQGKVRLLVQFGHERNRHIKDVPTVLELIPSESDRALMRFLLLKYKMTRPFALPPGVPAARVAAIRRAFDATMTDPGFLAETRRIGLDIDPLDGAGVAAVVREVMETPQATVDRLRAMILRGKTQGKKKG